MPTFFERDGVSLHYRDQGDGMPFVLQHGLGASLNQTFALFPPPPGVRLIGFDCRGHNRSALGPPESIGFDTFADDLVALLDHLGIRDAVVGGISMGAGVSLNLALRHRDRVRGLILSRPAWSEASNPFNARMFPWIAELIRHHGAKAGREVFRQSVEYAQMETESPDVAVSLANQFANPRADELAEVLTRIPADVPNRDPRVWSTIAVPTLVLANRRDPVHPFEFGERLAAAIPGAEFRELTAKSVDAARHEQEFREFVGAFLGRWVGGATHPGVS
jgi:pimeloyl-ACP methyl ester carboxylesterase